MARSLVAREELHCLDYPLLTSTFFTARRWLSELGSRSAYIRGKSSPDRTATRSQNYLRNTGDGPTNCANDPAHRASDGPSNNSSDR